VAIRDRDVLHVWIEMWGNSDPHLLEFAVIETAAF